jgi:uncharacterized spore protein YtfJ
MPDLDALLQGHRDAITARRIYGEPVEADGVTVVPAAAVFGGTGGGGDDQGNGGGGFGLIGRPVGAWVIREGTVRWQPAIDVSRIALLAFLLGLAFALRRRRG